VGGLARVTILNNVIKETPPRPSGWTPYQLQLGDLELRVAHRGKGGTPLLLVHGIGAHIDMWGPLERVLGGREVIAFDAPGTGGSPSLTWPRRMDGLAEIVRDLIDTLGHEQVDVLGVSFGGALAQELARRYPDRVRRLILCSTSAGIVCVPPKPLALALVMTPARYYHPALFRFIMPRLAGGRTARDPSRLADQLEARLSRPPDLIGYVSQLYAASGWTSAHYLHRLSQPTLVIAGDDDRMIPLANARFLAHRIPDARLRVVRGGGHAFLLDEPESVVEDIDAFLDQEARGR
jgi:poly(3-hydroxyalkanoate) depolymerase